MERVYEVTFEVVVSVVAESEQQAEDIACLDVTRGKFDEDAEFERAKFITIEEYMGTIPYHFKDIPKTSRMGEGKPIFYRDDEDEPQAKDDIAMSLID